MFKNTLRALVLSTTMWVNAGAFAQEQSSAPIDDRLRAIEQQLATQAQIIANQADHIRRQDRQINEQRAVIQSLIQQRGQTSAPQASLSPSASQSESAVAPTPAPRAPPVEVAQNDTAPPTTGSQAGADGDRLRSERAADQLLVDVGGVLLPRGSAQIEPSFDFTHASSDRVNIAGFTIFNAIVIGTIRVDDLDRDIFSGSMTGRIGLPSFCPDWLGACLWPHRTQLEMRTSGVFRQDRELRGIGTADVQDLLIQGLGLGDTDITLSWQPILADGPIPAVIVRGRARLPSGESAFEIPQIPLSDEPGAPTRLARAPTGNGFFGAGGGATAVWQYDPVVFFSSIGYMANVRQSFSGFGRIDPGDTLDASVGLNIVLNDRVSFNASHVYQRSFRSFAGGQALLGTRTTDGRLVFGASVSLNDHLTLVVNAQAGLTDASPDFALSVAIPFSFRNLF